MTDWTKIDWGDIVPRLVLYAAGKFRSTKWRGVLGGPAPGGKEARDFVQVAICKTIEGTRRWNPEKATLYQHLYGVVRSDMGHLAKSPDNTITLRATIIPDDDDCLRNRGSDKVVDINRLSSEQLSQEEQMIAQEGISHLLDFFEDYGDNDGILRRAANFIMDNANASAAEMASALGISRGDAYNLKKRLRRAAKRFLSESASNMPKDGTNE